MPTTGIGPLLIAAGICCAATSALASSSKWLETEGGRIRLLTTGSAGQDGLLRGALEISLKPGWKTYWRDPGDAGVPPQVDVSASENIASAEMSFPPPQRHDDGYAKWAGYDYPVTFPIRFKVSDPGAQSRIAASVFLGVCKEICIPVQGTLDLDPSADTANELDASVVQAGFDALPGPERDGFQAKAKSGDVTHFVIDAKVPGDPAAADLFVAAEDGYTFATPVKAIARGSVVFSVEILSRPDSDDKKPSFPYVLTSSDGAVAGTIALP